MAKDLNEQEGAVADSVSLKEVETQETKQESEVNASTDKFINECKDFIVNYAKTCYDYPEDQAYALREFFISKRIEDEAAKHQKNMKEADIVVDFAGPGSGNFYSFGFVSELPENAKLVE